MLDLEKQSGESRQNAQQRAEAASVSCFDAEIKQIEDVAGFRASLVQLEPAELCELLALMRGSEHESSQAKVSHFRS